MIVNYAELLDEVLEIAESMAAAELESCELLLDAYGQPLHREVVRAKLAIDRLSSIRRQLDGSPPN